LCASVCPSTDPDEYCNANCGAGPPTDGGTRSGYVYEKSPPCEPAAQEYVGDNDVAVNVPPDDDSDDDKATTVGPLDTVRFADTAPPALTEPISLRCWHPGTCGVVNTHAGRRTSRSRAPKSAPYALANDE
jgi:hypothetical protein